MSKLSLELHARLHAHNNSIKERSLNAPSVADTEGVADALINVMVEYRGDLTALELAGFHFIKRMGELAYTSVTLNQLAELEVSDSIIRIKLPTPNRLCLDKSIPDIRANDNSVRTRSGSTWSGNTGKGVIVGIIDTGIDYQHEVFRNVDGTTRILKIWDQTLTATGTEHPPVNLAARPPFPAALLNYGVEYDKDAIKNALGSPNPFNTVRHKDTEGHGTHVAGIACGNGSAADTCHSPFVYAGVAPEADIIVVRLRGLSEGDTGALGSDFDHALLYLEHEATLFKKPMAINLSFGHFFGERDGTDEDAHLIDQIIQAHESLRASENSSGLTIVQASGNDGDSKLHAEGTIPPNGDLSIFFNVLPTDKLVRNISIRYQEHPLSISLESPDNNNNVTPPLSANSSTPQDSNINGSHSVHITKQAGKIDITISNDGSFENSVGPWKIKLHSSHPQPIVVNAWIQDKSKDTAPTRFDGEKSGYNVNSRMTIDASACSFKSIVVGSYGAEWSMNYAGSGELADSSSRGPTFLIEAGNPVRKPDLCAPGADVTSAAVLHLDKPVIEWLRNCCCACCKSYTDEDGTSMAAPHVAGTVALMWQKNPILTAQEIKDKLIATARHDSKTGATPNDDWGAGKLDVKAALDAVTPIAAPAAPPIAVPLMAHQAPPQYHPLQTLQERFLASPKGGYLLKVGQKHFNEIRNLINANKRVATVWHRCQGPAWLRTGFTILSMPDMVIPEAIANVQLTEAVRKLTAILTRYGSPELVTDLEMYQPDLQILRGGVSVFDLAESFDLVEK